MRGAWGSGDLVKIGPTASDLSLGLFEYHLDFPGARSIQAAATWLVAAPHSGIQATVYAHVASDSGYPGRLALQYWLFYVFNDWNNLHEGDWEMIQLVFDARCAPRALTKPRRGRYSQHEGAERATWGETSSSWSTALIRSCIRRPAPTRTTSGRRSTSAALPRRASAATTRPARVSMFVRRSDDPERLDAGARGFPWIAFEGRWGELQRSFYNGPTGPNLKLQWTEPIRWSSDWRDRSYVVPAGGAFGTSATGFFCGAVVSGAQKRCARLILHPLPVVPRTPCSRRAPPVRALARNLASRCSTPARASPRAGPRTTPPPAHMYVETDSSLRRHRRVVSPAHLGARGGLADGLPRMHPA